MELTGLVSFSFSAAHTDSELRRHPPTPGKPGSLFPTRHSLGRRGPRDSEQHGVRLALGPNACHKSFLWENVLLEATDFNQSKVNSEKTKQFNRKDR